jgi:hypothetical protein
MSATLSTTRRPAGAESRRTPGLRLNRLLFCLPSKRAGIGLDALFQIVIRATSSSGISSRRCGRRVGGARSLCHSFRRWLGADRRSGIVWRCQRVLAEVQAGDGGSWSRPLRLLNATATWASHPSSARAAGAGRQDAASARSLGRIDPPGQCVTKSGKEGTISAVRRTG